MQSCPKRPTCHCQETVLANANVHASNCHNWTPLSEASHHGHPKVAKALLAHGANTESRDNLAFTPLNRAAQAGRLSLMILLLDMGKANINATNHDDWTSLAEASFHGYPDVAKALLDREASIESKNSDHETALDLAVRKKHKLVINEFLIHGNFCTDRDRRGKLFSKQEFIFVRCVLGCNRLETHWVFGRERVERFV